MQFRKTLRAPYALTTASVAVLMGSTAMTGSFIAPVHAQQAPSNQGPALEEVVVTGSRIVREDYEANSPVVTVDESLFDQSGSSALETQLNKLPQFTPTLKNPTQGGDIQPTATNTPGTATISLRGIGSNRSLVLLDGRRATPANASMVVDINSIPSAAIERVEILSGGASSTYGADAMAGVVNFILKKDVDGLELDVQSGITEHGDNFEYQISGIMGTDFDDGRGNVSVAFSTNERKKALQRDRKWYRNLWADPSIGGTMFFSPFTAFNTGFANLPDPGVLNDVIDGASFSNAPANTNIYTDFNGNAFSGTDIGGIPGVSGAEFIDGEQFVLLDNGQIGSNNIDNFLILPLKRYNMYSRGNYELNDWVGVFAQGYLSKTKTHTIQEPGPITSGWSVSIDPTINEGAIPNEMSRILQSRTRSARPGDADYIPGASPENQPIVSGANDPFDLRALLPFNRTSETDVFTYNMTVGLEGQIPGTDWTWEAFGSQGESETTVIQRGVVSLQRLRAIMNQPNFGQGFDSSTPGNGYGNEPDGGFGAATATCESGINPFAWGDVTQDCWDAVNGDLKNKSVMQQTIWEANTQGALLDLPAGEVRAAIGASYRENRYEFQNDTLTTQGTSFIEQALGIYPSGNSEGTIKVKEAYGEFLVPVLSDLPAVQQLDLELGLRMSDYNTTGTSWTYKALVNWQVNDWVRLRGGYNRAERAPNVAELFLASQQTFGLSSGGDVCSLNNGQSFSANPNVNSNWREALAICGQIMEGSGDPDADETYYGVSTDNLIQMSGTDLAALRDQENSPINAQAAGAAFTFSSLSGNEDVTPEKADTWTFGAVINSPFQSPALSDLRFSVDYYNIKVKNAIGAQTVDIVQRQCFDPAFNPNLDASTPFCQGVVRNTTGALGNVQTTFLNSGRFKTSGIDLQVDWGMEAGPGRITVNSVFNYLIEMKSAELEVLPLVDYAGTLGPDQNGLNGSSYRYQALTTVGYGFNNGLYLGVQWQHLPSIKAASAAIVPDTATTGAPSYNLFNLQGSYALLDNVGLRFGIENLFNKKPPITGVNTAASGSTLPGGTFNTNNYDVNGRRFYAGANLQF